MVNKKLYNFSENINKYLFKTTLLSCLKLIATICFSWIFSYLLENIIYKNFNLNYAYIVIFIVLIIFIRQFSTKKVAEELGELVIDVKRSLRKAIFEKILKLGLNYSKAFKIQEFIHLSVDNVEHLEVYFGGFLTQFYYCLISSFILGIAIFPLNFKIALILILFSIAIPLFLYVSLNNVKKIQKKYFAKYMNVGTLFLDSLQGLTTLKLYGTDEDREKEIAKMSEEFRVETMKVLKMQLLSITVVNWIIYSGTILAIIYAVKLFLGGTLNLFALLFIFMLAPEFFIPMRTLTALFHAAMTGVSAADNILNFLEIEEIKKHGTVNFPTNSNIEIKNLNFSYSKEKNTLKNINMTFSKNNFTAIVGHSGCGKSTLASILNGEIDSSLNDTLKIGNINFNEIKSFDLTKNILKVTHDGHIFNSSVRENLLIANPNASDEDMIFALKKVKLWHLFKNREGLETILESQGKNLSGGQAQRISLARALIYNAEIYIFDEATSNIDIESEEIILKTIYEMAKTKIVIYISHRLPAIKNADMIYVMDKGEIIEKGKHSELFSQNGLYTKMYTQQEELENYLTKRGRTKNEKVSI